jgi:uncharacterized protein with NAD-binding domain and iron-sulfur cluster
MLRGQKYVEETDKYTFAQWLKLQGVSDEIQKDVFIAASKSLNFISRAINKALCKVIRLWLKLKEELKGKKQPPFSELCQLELFAKVMIRLQCRQPKFHQQHMYTLHKNRKPEEQSEEAN